MEKAVEAHPTSGSRVKFIVGGVLIFAAIAYLIISSTKANAQYFFTIDELLHVVNLWSIKMSAYLVRSLVI